MAKLAATVIGILFFIFLLFLHLPKLLSNVYNPSEWVTFLEKHTLVEGGFFIARLLPTRSPAILKRDKAINNIAIVGKYLVAIAILIFDIQHIMYEFFLSHLSHRGYPAKVVFSYISIVAFILTAVNIIIKIGTRLSLTLTGNMIVIFCFF